MHLLNSTTGRGCSRLQGGLLRLLMVLTATLHLVAAAHAADHEQVDTQGGHSGKLGPDQAFSDADRATRHRRFRASLKVSQKPSALFPAPNDDAPFGNNFGASINCTNAFAQQAQMLCTEYGYACCYGSLCISNRRGTE